MTLIQIPKEQWSEPEKWVWEEICAGQIADFNTREGRQDAPLKPACSQGWGEERKLRADFLKQILLRQPYSSKIPTEGVQIVGAWFPEGVELGNGQLARQLWLANCRFEGPANLTGLQIKDSFSLAGSTFAEQDTGATSVNLSRAKVGGQLSLDRVKVEGKLDMNRLDVAQDLFMSEGATFKDVDLKGAKVGGQLSLDRVKVDGKLDMNGLDVAQHLFMSEGATFKDVNLSVAKVGGQLSLERAKVDGKLTMNSLDVQHLLMQQCATFKDVELANAKVDGHLSLEGAKVDGKLNMNSLDVAQHLFMSEGATFKDVDLTGAKVGGQLSLDGAMFLNVDLKGAKAGGQLSLEGTTVDGKLNMNSLDVAQILFMGKGATFKDVDLKGAKVGGQLSLDRAKVDGKLDMNGLDVAQHLFMSEGATFKDVELANAKVGGQLNLIGTTVDGKLDMNGLDVARDLLMHKGAKFKDVDLKGAKVGGQLNLEGATVDGKLTINNLVVEGDVYMRGSTFNEMVDFLFARVGRNLDLSGSKLTGLDLSGTRIEGELRLGSNQHSRTRWRKSDALGLNLRNVHIGALQDRRDRVEKCPWWRRLFGGRDQWEDAWPAKLQLDGFTYDRLGGFGGTADRGKDLQANCDTDMQARDIRWYIDWLDRDQTYNPQPYEQLAGVFHAVGDPTKSNRILYVSRRRARTEAWWKHEYFRWLGSALLDWTIGYGLGGRYFWALGWVIIAFTAIGAGVLYVSGQPIKGLDPGLPARLIYSLDQLLPIVEFEKYDSVALTGWVAYYFYVQKLIGWALGSFLVAGLAGLTQKR